MNWDSSEPGPLKKGRVPITYGQTGYVKPFIKYHTALPPAIDDNVVLKLMEQMLTLRSEATIADTMTLISNGEIQPPTGLDGHPFRPLIDEIDEYCSIVIRFLTASNWSVSYSMISSQITMYKNFTGGENDVVPNIDLLSMVYLDDKAMILLFKEMWHFISTIRSTLHQSLVFYFLSSSLEYWGQARPEELYNAVSNEASPLAVEASGFFDYMYTATENSKYSAITTRFLSMLLCLMPNVFATYLSSGIKRFSANSKKLKLLNFIKSQVNSKRVGDLQLLCMANICTAASNIFLFDEKNPIVTFAMSVREDAQTAFYSYANDMSPSIIHLYTEFFIAYSVMRPEFLFEDFHNLLEKKDAEPSIVCCIATALRAFGASAQYKKTYLSYMERNGRVLRNMIWKQSRLLLKTRASGTSSKKSLSTSNSESVSLPILVNVFFAFIPHPHAYFEDFDLKQAILPVKHMDPIVTSLIDNDNDLVKASTEFVLALISTSRLSKINPDKVTVTNSHIVTEIYSCAGYLIKAISDKIIDTNLNDARLMDYLDLIKELLISRAFIGDRFQLLKKSNNNFDLIEGFETRQRLYTSLETVIIYCLCSTDIEVYKNIIQIIENALKDGHATENRANHIYSCPFLYNYDSYREFNEGNFIITGQVALHKRIRKIVSGFTVATDGVIQAWETLNVLWSGRSSQDYYRNTFISEMRNYAGLLAALCGCIVATDPETNDKIANILPVTHQYIRNVVDFIDSPNMIVGDACKEILARDLAKEAIPFGYKYLTIATAGFLKLQNKEQVFKILEQVISTIKINVTRCVEEKMEVFPGAVETLMLIATYLSEQDFNNLSNLKLRIRVCNTIALSEGNRELIGFRLSRSMRYSMVLLFCDWFEKASFYNESDAYAASSLSTTERRFNDIEHMYDDLALGTAKVVASLSEKSIIEVPRTGNEEDYMQAKSTQCAQFFSLAMRLLEKHEGNSEMSDINGSSRSSTIAKTLTSSASVPSSSYSGKQQNQRSLAIVECCIKALANSTRLNMDVAMKFAIPMGYHKNPKIRTAFLGIFKDLVLQGKTNILDASEEDKYNSLMRFLADNLYLCIDLCDNCPASEVDGLASALMDLYETQGNGLQLLKAAVTREIENTVRVVDLLRRNSVATRMLALYARKYGSEYLSSTLAPVLQEFVDSPEDHVFEISADKLGSQDNRASENIEKFMRSLSALSNAFLRSVTNMPLAFREICYTIQKAAVPKFPEASATSVGSFLFLRFFCPAIVAPENDNLLRRHPRRDIRRSLLLLAKVIQNMANGSLYSLKLPLLYDRMSDLNRINDDIVQFMQDSAELPFLKDKSKLFDTSPVVEADSTAENIAISKVDLMFIHEYLYNHWDDIHSRLKTLESKGELYRKSRSTKTSADSLLSSNSDSTGSDTYIADSAIYNKLDDLLESLGQPKGNSSYELPENVTKDTSEAGMRLYEFMAKNAAKDFGSISEHQMVREAVTKDGVPFLVLNLSLIPADNTVDVDLLTFRYFQVATHFWDKKWVVFLDGTGFSSNNSVPLEFIQNVDRLFPPSLKTCIGAYFYNVSSALLPYIKILADTFSAGASSIFNPYTIPWNFESSFYETEGMKEPPFGLSRLSKRIIKDSRVEYNNVTIYMEEGDYEDPAEMRIGQEYVQVCKLNPVMIDCGGRTRYVRPLNVYHVVDIKKAYISKNTTIENEFAVLLDDGTEFTLFSESRSDIIRSINNMIAKYSEHSSSTSVSEMTVHSIKDVSATFVTMAFSGMTCGLNEIRSEAYGLGCAAVYLFNISTGRSQVVRKGIFFPKHNVKFCQEVSNTIATYHPQMTKDFIKAFSLPYVNSEPDQRGDLIVILSEWVKNIYKYVYLADDKRGKRRTRDLIRKLIKLTVLYPEQVAIFHRLIWEPICSTVELGDLLVEEIIEAAIDRKSEGGNCEEVLSLLTIAPTLELCSKVINRLRATATVPLETSAALISHVQGNWLELTVLVKACIALFFDSLKFTRAFVPDICFICSVFIDIGPYEFRSYLHELILNSVHTYTSTPNLSVEDYNKLNLIIERICGSRAKLVFGLNKTNDDLKKMTTGPEVMAGLEFMAESILQFIEIIADENEKKSWTDQWLSMVADACFKKASLVRGRALIMLGLLAKGQSAELLISKLLKLMSRTVSTDAIGDDETAELNTCLLYCSTKLMDSIPSNSPWFGVMFWLGAACSQFSYVSIYLGGIQLMAKTLEKLDEYNRFPDGDVVGYLTKERNRLGANYVEMDKILDIQYNPSQFHIYIVSQLLKGIHVASTRHATLSVMETIMDICAKNSKIYKEIHFNELSNSQEFILLPAIYMVFLFIYSRSHKEKKKFLRGLYDETKLIPIGYGLAVPAILVEYFKTDTDQSAIVLFMVSLLLSEPNCEDSVLLKFFRSFITLDDSAPRPKFLTYVCLNKKLQDICDHSPSLSLVQASQDFATDILTHPSFDANRKDDMKKQLSSLINEYRLTKLNVKSMDSFDHKLLTEQIIHFITFSRRIVNTFA